MATSAAIFSNNTGLVCIVENSGSQPTLAGKVMVKGFKPASALISGIDYGQAVNVQFQSSLGRAVYAYVFGDNMGQLTVQGIAFHGTCQNRGSSGIVEILEYYAANRASKIQDPVTVTLGDTVITGFLVASSVRNVTASTDEAAAFSQFTLTIAALPQR